MQKVWDYVIGGALTVWFTWWVGKTIVTPEPWQAVVVCFVCGVGTMASVVELRGAIRVNIRMRKLPPKQSGHKG